MAVAVCTVSGSTVSFVGIGTCTVDANQTGNVAYDSAGQISQSFSVAQAPQLITFTSSPPAEAHVAGSPYGPSASGGDSGNPVTFTSASPDVCTLSGSAVTFLAVGTCTVDADQAGSTDYLPAPEVSQSFAVGAELGGSVILAINYGLHGHEAERVSGFGWNVNGSTSVTISQCASNTYSASACDPSSEVTAAVGTGTRAGQIHAVIILDTGTIDTDGDTCGLSSSGPCYLLVQGTGAQTASAPLAFSPPAMGLARTAGVLANAIDKVSGKYFPSGDTVVAEECDATVSVPDTVITHCDPATEESSVATAGGAVTFSTFTVLAGATYSDAAGGTCTFGDSCQIVVVDQSDPSIFLSRTIGLATPTIALTKTTSLLGNFNDIIRTTGLPVGDTVVAEECDATVSVPDTVTTHCDPATEMSGTVGTGGKAVFSSGLRLVVGGAYSDAASGSCVPGGNCVVVLADPQNAELNLSESIAFSSLTAKVGLSIAVRANALDLVSATHFPVGDHVAAEECDVTVSVPASLATNCDPTLAITGIAGSTGTVLFTPTKMTVLVGNAYLESGSGVVAPGGTADIVVDDSDDPGLSVALPITLAP